jgi:hypothetical protein
MDDEVGNLSRSNPCVIHSSFRAASSEAAFDEREPAMKRLIAAASIALLPLTAQAADAVPAGASGPAPVVLDDRSFGTSDNVLAIGVGALAGIALLHGAFSLPPALSAVVGGIGGHWWYKQYEAEHTIGFKFRVPSQFAISHSPDSVAQRQRWLGAAEPRI